MQRGMALGSVLLLCLSFFTACAEQEDFTFHCPRCDETVTWEAYGAFRFDMVGNDATARRLVAECGWHVQGGHNGGVGDTLQVAACGQEGVTLVWAFNSLQAVRLAAGWGGATEAGIRLGARVDEVRAAYPALSRVHETLYRIDERDTAVEARFDSASQGLTELVSALWPKIYRSMCDTVRRAS